MRRFTNTCNLFHYMHVTVCALFQLVPFGIVCVLIIKMQTPEQLNKSYLLNYCGDDSIKTKFSLHQTASFLWLKYL